MLHLIMESFQVILDLITMHSLLYIESKYMNHLLAFGWMCILVFICAYRLLSQLRHDSLPSFSCNYAYLVIV